MGWLTRIHFLVLGLVAIMALSACEDVFIPDFADEDPTVVIEGFISEGPQTTPTYVTISKTYPLFQTSDDPQPFQLYLGGAQVSVFEGETEFDLTEICAQSLEPEQLELLLNLLNLDTLAIEEDICFYADLFGLIQPEAGKQYDLKILFEGDTITASTTIPAMVPLDSFKIEQVAGFPDFRELNAFMTDPAGPNFYRLKASVNGSDFLADFGSVTDDVFFDNKEFDFPINKPTVDRDSFDPNTAGLYSVGDTTVLEWSMIDADHYEFWNTLEFAQANQGPFSSYSRAKSNITGGIGIWGGYNTQYYQIIID